MTVKWMALENPLAHTHTHDSSAPIHAYSSACGCGLLFLQLLLLLSLLRAPDLLECRWSRNVCIFIFYAYLEKFSAAILILWNCFFILAIYCCCCCCFLSVSFCLSVVRSLAALFPSLCIAVFAVCCCYVAIWFCLRKLCDVTRTNDIANVCIDTRFVFVNYRVLLLLPGCFESLSWRSVFDDNRKFDSIENTAAALKFIRFRTNNFRCNFDDAVMLVSTIAMAIWRCCCCCEFGWSTHRQRHTK